MLINNPSKYFNHYLFDRTEIKGDIKSFELNEDSYAEYIEYLWTIIQENFNQGYNKGLMVFNTIKSSRLVYDKLSDFIEEKREENDSLNLEGFDIDLLNSSLIPSTKREIISKINNFDDDKKYILISTQSVEAGVDVSFDFVVRDFAIIDSIEQIRGRCNRSREINKRFDESKKGNIYLTKLIHKNKKHFYEYIYNEYELKTRIFSTINLLDKKLSYSFSDINDYYLSVSNSINLIHDEKEKSHFIDRDNIKYLNKMIYSKLMDIETGIHIIEANQMQCSIFVCSDVNVFSEKLDTNIFDLDVDNFDDFFIKHEGKSIFSLNELKFIKTIDFEEELYGFNCIHGDSLLNYYKLLLNNIDKENDYFHYRLLQKEFSSIFYKFIINVSLNPNDNLFSEIDEGLEKIGYFYVLPNNKLGDDEYDLYSLERGFNYKP